ncbi:MAG: hypothetical protein DWQ02_14375 [Bacteroidetes bacterium]|nr:MAG: hypothetical protein DWQ02_14375 [Bacteroidota bacterium]
MFLSYSLVTLLFLGASVIEKKIRSDFHSGKLSEEKLEKIINNQSYENTPLTNAYKGLCETMMAEYVYLPTSKLKYFNRGKKKIDQAIVQAQGDPELRYIRMMVQLNAPSFLGYTGKIQEDLKIFIKNKNQFDGGEQWLKTFANNLLQTKNLTAQQRDQLVRFRETI